MNRFVELDYLVEDTYCYSKFHTPYGAIIRQLPKLTDTKFENTEQCLLVLRAEM